ncbi:class I SAM-dependent methyltransferase [Solirubrobacter phytolaccae]|uniref:Class I SAM-dependent methyltransferase n=1 Tax=Solirubrobacter phytolaccae TaxID=1404360 RepID=A0A9X3NFM3_9ACTN|nr:class I SAM-dependent methyltransferase [Solirubrobacter phytolaccae]MDA0184389.1 class I SAM-dependent methyltransferase [Solirubrobacter phytolaccae]
MGILERWDAQQAAYIADREGRFAIMLDVLALTVGEAPLVVDLACGPGSLSARVLARFPAARVVALDLDPLLLQVAEESLAPYADRLTLLDADLTADDWPAAVSAAFDGEPPKAAVSTTALHWLTPSQLVGVYAHAATLLAPGGVLLNGDHFRFSEHEHPTLHRAAGEHDAATQRRAFADGAPDWEAWWTEARALPGGAELGAERDRRFAARPAPEPTTIEFQLAALRQAGFDEVAPVWQLLDFGRTSPSGSVRG